MTFSLLQRSKAGPKQRKGLLTVLNDVILESLTCHKKDSLCIPPITSLVNSCHSSHAHHGFLQWYTKLLASWDDNEPMCFKNPTLGMPAIPWQASICCRTRGFVGAKKTIFPEKSINKKSCAWRGQDESIFTIKDKATFGKPSIKIKHYNCRD